MAKGKDVAWGFFYQTAHYAGEFYSGLTELTVNAARREARRLGWKPGPIFRITPPKPKRRGK